MLYRVELAGFSSHFNTVAELKNWAEKLNAQYKLTGEVCRVYKANWVAKDGSGASYNGKPSAEIVIGA